MREVEITDPDSVNDWEKGDINSTSIETEELGELDAVSAEGEVVRERDLEGHLPAEQGGGAGNKQTVMVDPGQPKELAPVDRQPGGWQDTPTWLDAGEFERVQGQSSVHPY